MGLMRGGGPGSVGAGIGGGLNLPSMGSNARDSPWQHDETDAVTVGQHFEFLQRLASRAVTETVLERRRSIQSVANRANAVATDDAPRLSKYRGFIHPRGTYRQVWDIVLAVCLLYVMAVVPFRVAFELDATGFMLGLERTMDVLFMFDILVNFATGIAKAKNQVDYNLAKIARRYMRLWFWLDLLASFPYWTFDGLVTGDTGSEGECRRMDSFGEELKLLRFIRVVRIVRLVRLFQFSRMFSRWQSRLNVNKGVLVCTKFAFLMFFIAHLLGCFFFFSASLYNYSDQTWVYYYRDRDMSSYPLEWTACNPGLRWNWYFASMYWAATTITTVGYGDATPYNDVERVFSLFAMVVGASFYAYVVGNMASISTYFNPIQKMVSARITDVSVCMEKRKLPHDLRVRIREHYLLNFAKDKLHAEEQLMLSEVSVALRSEVLGFHMASIPVFDGVDPSLWQAVGPYLSLKRYTDGTVVFGEEQNAEFLYFVLQGSVMVFVSADAEPIPLRQGAYFGEIGFYNRVRRHTATVLADSLCEVILMDRRGAALLEAHYPQIVKEFRQIGVERLRHSHGPHAADDLQPTWGASSPVQPLPPPSPLSELASAVHEHSKLHHSAVDLSSPASPHTQSKPGVEGHIVEESTADLLSPHAAGDRQEQFLGTDSTEDAGDGVDRSRTVPLPPPLPAAEDSKLPRLKIPRHTLRPEDDAAAAEQSSELEARLVALMEALDSRMAALRQQTEATTHDMHREQERLAQHMAGLEARLSATSTAATVVLLEEKVDTLALENEQLRTLVSSQHSQAMSMLSTVLASLSPT